MLKQVARFLGAAASICALLLLAACGGGGGSPGTVAGTAPGTSPETPPLSVSGLTLLNLQVGVGASARAPIPITGGTPPYTVVSSNETVVQAAIGADNHLVLNAVNVGNTWVTVQDRAGAQVILLVRVDPVQALPLAVSSSSLTLPINIPATVILTGGLPPYRVLGGIPAALSVSQVPGVSNEFQIVGTLVLGAYDIVFADAANQTVRTSVTITAATTGVRLSPSALTISELGNDATQPIRLTVFGAVGPFTVFSSHLNLLRPAVLTHPAGATAIEVVTGLAGNRCVTGTLGTAEPIIIPEVDVTITVVDSTRAVATSVIKIQNSALPCP